MSAFLIFFTFYLIVFAVIAPIVLCVGLWGYLYAILFWGAIYVPSTKEKVERMVKLLQVKPGQKIIDLGAGDGRLLIALAKEGVKAYGYEINPFLVSRAMKNIREAGMVGKAFVYWKSMWSVNLKDYDAVVMFPMGHIMKSLENKFNKELKTGSKVISNTFDLPNWKPEITENHVYLYIKK